MKRKEPSRVTLARVIRTLEDMGCEVVVGPRHFMGWPCFHCGRTLKECQKKKCCKKCGKNGRDSHG